MAGWRHPSSDQAVMSTILFVIQNVTAKEKGRLIAAPSHIPRLRAYSIDRATKRTSPWAFATRSRADFRPWALRSSIFLVTSAGLVTGS